MAQYDTGLGWEADASWLDSAGDHIIATIRPAMDWNTDLVPIFPLHKVTHNELAQAGYVYRVSNGVDWYCGVTIHPSYSLKFLYYHRSGYSTIRIACICNVAPTPLDYSASFYNGYFWRTGDDQESAYGNNRNYAFTNYFNYDSSYGFYIYDAFETIGADEVPTGRYVGTNLQDAIAHEAGASYTAKKVNSGWAVACLAEWKTDSAKFKTPVLISSVSEYTDMTLSNEAYSLAKLNIMLDGMKFYMSFFPINTEVTVEHNLANFDWGGSSSPTLTLPDLFNAISSPDYANIRVLDSPDPYQSQGGSSSEAGGDGNDVNNVPVPDETHSIPSGDCFYTIYTPSRTDLVNLTSWMWGSLDLNNFKRLFTDPMQCVIGLGVVPLTLTGTPTAVYLGNIDTGLTMPKVTDEIYEVNFGNITIKEKWGCYLDYAPYTKISIFLPFIGYQELNTDDVMGKTLLLKYQIDILTGSCIAKISDLTKTNSVLYQFSGQCLRQLPVNGTSLDSIISSGIGIAATIGTALATEGATAPFVVGAVSSVATQAISTKQQVQRSGSISGPAGLMGQYKPYIVRSTPKQVIPGYQNKFIGYPAFINKNLGTLSGYNEISSVHLEGIPATGNELAEIESLLKGGVIF